MPRSSNTQFALLGMLTRKPMSGYDIKKELNLATSFFWSESDGQLYPILAKLVKEKMLTVTQKDGSGTRAKKIYTVTTAGKKHLRQWIEAPTELHTIRHARLLKLYFGANIGPEGCMDLLDAGLVSVKSTLKTLELERQTLLKAPKTPHTPYSLMTLEYGEALEQAKLAWYQTALKKLKKM
jgi:PadR family transcriptional regulator, regulatory protein AphA